MNIRTCQWDEDLLNLFCIDKEQLCELRMPGEICGYIQREFASLTGLKEGIPVISAGGDQQCGAVGHGVFKSGKLPIRSMSVSALTKYALGDPDKKIREKGMEILEGSIHLAADLGIRTVMIPGYDIYYGESTIQTKQFFLENIKKAAEITEKEGVLIGFETMENDFMNTVGKAMKYVRLVDSSYLKVYPDAGNITNAGVKLQQDVCEDMLLGKGNMIALHLKETRPGVFREVPFLTGHVDFEAIIHMAWNMGIRRYVTELWDVGQDDWKEAICFANQSMRCILDKQSEMEDRKII